MIPSPSVGRRAPGGTPRRVARRRAAAYRGALGRAVGRAVRHRRASAAGSNPDGLDREGAAVRIELPWSISPEEASQRVAALARFVRDVDEAYAAKRTAALGALEQGSRRRAPRVALAGGGAASALNERRGGGRAVAQRVAEEVERDNRHHDHDPRRVDLPPVPVGQVGRALREHATPVHRRRRQPEAEEAQRREDDDRVGHLESGVHDDRAGDVRDEVARDDAKCGRAPIDRGRRRRTPGSQRERLAADKARRAEPGEGDEHDDQEPARSARDRRR